MLVDETARLWAMRFDPMAALEVFELRRAASEARPAAIAKGERLEGSLFAKVVDGVAVVPVKGPLLRTMNWAFWSYEEVQRDVELALAHRDVTAIVLDIDSPGGLAAGCADLAAWLRSKKAEKPVVAFVGTMGASAAYMIASACDEIVLGSGAVVGSLGTVIEYVDFEPFFEKLGARVVRVVAEQSPNKRLDPDSDEGKAEMQAICDEGCAEFIAAVAEGRGTTEAEVVSGYGQGMVFAPGQALDRGMADRSGTLDGLIAELAGRGSTSNAVPAAAAKEIPMNWETITAAELREHRPDLVEAIEGAASAAAAKASEDAAKAAADAERARILSLDEIATEGHEELVTAAKADGETTAEQLALQILKSDKGAGARHLSERQSADTDVPAAPSAGGGGSPKPSDNAPIEERCKAEWDGNADLRAEFGNDFDSYLSFAKAEEGGRVRIKRAS